MLTQNLVRHSEGSAVFAFTKQAVEFKIGTSADDGQQVGFGVLKFLWHFFGRTEPVPHVMLDNPLPRIDIGGTVFLIGIGEEQDGKLGSFASQAEIAGLVNDLDLLACLLDAIQHELGEFVFVGKVHNLIKRHGAKDIGRERLAPH